MSSTGAGASRRVDLAQVSVPRLLFALLHQRFSGTLVVAQPPPQAGSRTLWFRGGMPVYTDWVVPSEVLGQVLVTHRMIDEGQLLRALEAMAAQGGLLGQHLLAHSALDSSRLFEGLRVQCTRKLTHAFMLRGGEGVLHVGDDPRLELGLLPVNVLGLILTGVRATYDEARVAAEMGPALQAPVRVTSALSRYCSHFHFRPDDEPALQALAAGTQLAQLSALPGWSVRRAAQLIYVLWACQMLRTGTSAEAAPSGPQPAVSRPGAGSSSHPGVAGSSPSSPGVAASSPSRPGVASSSPSHPGVAGSAPSGAGSSAPAAGRASAPGSDSAAPGRDRPRKPTLVDTSAPDDPDDPFIADLRAIEAKLGEHVHAFELFGVPLDATKKDVRRAWGDLSRKFHPDALRAQGREALHDRVSKVFAALSEAQQVLNDAEQRAELKHAVESGEHEATKGGKDATATARAVFQSELLAREADKLLRASRFDRALARYREASSLNADEPDLRAAITWCEFQVSPQADEDAVRARKELLAVIDEAPNIARAHYFLGFVLIAQGQPAVAIETFRRAAQLDPRLIDAERQARALEVRMGRTPPAIASSSRTPSKPKRSGLKGLFGKK